jgi:hypothetical protein
MTIGPDNLGNGSAVAQDRFAAQLSGYRGARRDGLGDPGGDPDLAPRNGNAPSLESPMLPSLDMDGLAEPVYPPSGWLDMPVQNAQMGTLADHPLLRGLLLELPPKEVAPDQAWLDRWFEAARSILELLYVQGSIRR